MRLPSISVIIPVYHETDMINATIAHLKSMGQPEDAEIIVVDGHPQGDTIDQVADATVRCFSAKKGRGAQMNKGAVEANGRILVFLHADTTLPSNAFWHIKRSMTDSRVAAGAFTLGIASTHAVFRLIGKGAAMRTRLTRIPYGDQAIFMERSFFLELGGFKDIPIMEDVELMQRVKKSGKRIVIIPQKVKTSPRRWQKEGVIYCTLRNWGLICLYHLGVPPQRLVKYYR